MKLPAPLAFLALTAAAIGFVGCATTPAEVNTEFDPQADFTGARTFAILPLPKEIPGADPGLAMRIGGTAEETIRTAMVAKGYTEVAKEDADIAVLLHGRLVPKTEVTEWGFTPYFGAYGWNRGYRGYYSGMYGGNSVTVDQYNEGTMIAEVYDVSSKSMIWVGWITGRANLEREGEQERVAIAIDRILAAYPARGAAPVGVEM